MPKIVAPVTVQIRTDTQAGVIRANVVLKDGEEIGEIATVNWEACKRDQQLFEDWKEAVKAHFHRMMQEWTGGIASETFEIKPNTN